MRERACAGPTGSPGVWFRFLLVALVVGAAIRGAHSQCTTPPNDACAPGFLDGHTGDYWIDGSEGEPISLSDIGCAAHGDPDVEICGELSGEWPMPSVWYRVKVNEAKEYTFSTCAGGTPKSDTVLAIYAGTCQELLSSPTPPMPVKCDDHGCCQTCRDGSIDNPRASLTVRLNKNTEYRLGVFLKATGAMVTNNEKEPIDAVAGTTTTQPVDDCPPPTEPVPPLIPQHVWACHPVPLEGTFLSAGHVGTQVGVQVRVRHAHIGSLQAGLIQTLASPLRGPGSFLIDSGRAWSYEPAGEVSSLHFASNKRTLTWDDERSIGSYQLYRGNLPTFGPDYGACEQQEIPFAMTNSYDTPAAGAGFYFLATAGNRLAERGTKGFDSQGNERQGAVCP